jgi:ribosomal protein S18 acetylase RimI-like enzyme
LSAAPGAPPRYSEAARSYITTLVLFSALVVGFILDLVIGGGIAHLAGWLIAIVLVVGAEALTVYAARSTRSIAITEDEVRVGEEVVSLAEITGVEQVTEFDDRIMGRRYATGLPRGTQAVRLSLGERAVVIATRHADRLIEAITGGSVAEPAGLVIRLAGPEDLDGLADIADRADSLFRVSGHDLPIVVAVEDAPEPKAVFLAGAPTVGFAELGEVDGEAYLAELAVIPGQMRRGYGTALVEACCDWALEHGYQAMTLTTFADIAWNAPFYRRLGFTEVTELTAGFVAVRAREQQVGLDAVGRRIVMRRTLT